jgi:DNA polymerase-3 subunit delta
MLAPLCARVEQGQRVDNVVQYVWQRDRALVGKIVGRWTSQRLAEAFTRVQELERNLLLSPVPGQAALGELLLQLARAARG